MKNRSVRRFMAGFLCAAMLCTGNGAASLAYAAALPEENMETDSMEESAAEAQEADNTEESAPEIQEAESCLVKKSFGLKNRSAFCFLPGR